MTDFSERVLTHQGSETADHLEQLASELAATQEKLTTAQTAVVEMLHRENAAISRAEAAESRLGEVEKALEAFINEPHLNWRNELLALIVAWRAGK
jgi:methylphosphotriester-DNA--protein-cysteine methyltransferase